MIFNVLAQGPLVERCASWSAIFKIAPFVHLWRVLSFALIAVQVFLLASVEIAVSLIVSQRNVLIHSFNSSGGFYTTL